MRQNPLLLSIALIGLSAEVGRAQSGDPSDHFLNAYMSFQKGEKAEGANNHRAAATSFKSAITALDEIRDRWPTWNPPIVKHRRDRAAEALARVQPLAGKTPPAGTAEAAPEDDLSGPLPGGNLSLIPPSDDALDAPAATPSAPTSPPRGGGGDPIREIQSRFESLQTDLKETRERLARVTEERTELARKYEQAIKDAEGAVKKQKMITDRADRAEEALMNLEKEGARNSDEAKRIRAELASARKALGDAKIEREAAEEVRQQTADRLRAATSRIANISQERDAATKASADVPTKLAAMQKEINKVLDEKNALGTKLEKVEKQLATVTAERDDALAQVTRMKDAQKQVDKLLADNTALMAKLADAEKTITQFKTEGVKKDEEIAGLRKEMTSVKKQLADAQKQSADYQTQMADLQTRLEVQSKELLQTRSDAKTTLAERKKLQEENEVLRGIVVRQMKEQARRDQTKKLVLGELAKLEIQSKALIGQIEYLGQPVVKLSERERKLFKQPLIEISEAEISIAAPKEMPAGSPEAPGENGGTPPAGEQAAAGDLPAPTETAASPAPAPNPAADAQPPAQSSAAPELPPIASQPPANSAPAMEVASAKVPPPSLSPTPPDSADKPAAGKGSAEAEAELPTKDAPRLSDSLDATGTSAGGVPSVSTSVSPNVPPELLPLAREGKEQFERAQYREAEKTYERLLAKVPNNLYALSNLGVVRFRAGKLKHAEEAFKKAIAVAPEDAFSHCTLGIVYYSQGKYDEAVNELTKALAINPKNPTAHNYLGITASQKGWQEAAQKELETATALDPNYADAFFNLAVVYATQQPPNKETARKHYKRATELGAEPDSALEQLIK
jgi:tetratricopeptide (TPR) repeat protein